MIDVPVRVRDALKSGAYKNNYRVVVLDSNGDEDFTIENDNLVSESVKVNERMCSADELKFGLCEGTNIEFQYFDKANITGRKIKLYIDVNYRDADKALQIYSIPMGWYDISECSRQASTGIIKASGYNKLLSDYLDQDVTDVIEQIPGDGLDSDKVSVYQIENLLLQDYSIQKKKVIDQIDVGSISYIGTTHYNTSSTFTYNSATCYPVTNTVARIVNLDDKSMATKRVAIQNVSEYVAFIKKCYASLKTAFVSKCGSSAWSVFLKSNAYCDACLTLKVADSDTAKRTYYTEQSTSPKETTYVASCGVIYEDITITPNTFHYLYFNVPHQVYLYDTSAGTIINIWDNPYSDEYASESTWGNLQCCSFETNASEEISVSKSDLQNVTLREIQSASFEMLCQYGKLDRVTDLFSGVTLNGSRLYPADTLYPADDLYPVSASERADKAMYQKLWADEGNIRKFRNLIVTYKDSTTNADATITTVVNDDGTDDYVMDDNWLFKNLSWTSAQIKTYISTMVTAMQNVTWFPFQMWCAGLPYIETGDEIEVSVGGKTYPTYVLTRTLSGIQNLQDTFANGTLNIF